MKLRRHKPGGFTLTEVIAATGITAVIFGLSATVIFSMGESARRTRDSVSTMSQAENLFQQLQLDLENRVTGRDVAIILGNPDLTSGSSRPVLQIITEVNSPATYRFPISVDEPARGISTIAYRLGTGNAGPPGIERGIAGFSKQDKFMGLMPPPNFLFAQLATRPAHEFVDMTDWQPVPLENWPVPEEFFAPISEDVVAIGLAFQLAQPWEVNQAVLPIGSITRNPPLLPEIDLARPRLVDLEKIGALHVAVVVNSASTRHHATPAQWQALHGFLQNKLSTAPAELTPYQIWHPTLEERKNFPGDFPPTVTASLRVYQQVYRLR